MDIALRNASIAVAKDMQSHSPEFEMVIPKRKDKR